MLQKTNEETVQKAAHSVGSSARERARSKRRPMDLTISSHSDLENLVLASQLL